MWDNIQVLHNSVDITEWVISYEREVKVCTGVGTLMLTVSDSYGTTFDPWDEIDIYEYGDFECTYYVNNEISNEPGYSVTLECQDNSKRLTDYFIDETFEITSQQHTGKWIRKILDLTGTSYTFVTGSVGQIMNNNTTLGAMGAMEQITQLLQMSGWYIYFEGNGNAVVGSLFEDDNTAKGSADESNIISIVVASDDKMLRNRAVVWGGANADGQQVFANVSTQTPWNYDSQDQRAIVIANSNIGSRSDATKMAGRLINEFAKITVEKRMEIAGHIDARLGQSLRVNCNSFSGVDIITTFGTSMSKDGFITNVILGERCPRLYGFYRLWDTPGTPGQCVYVGTEASGIWKKELNEYGSWYDFSNGLTCSGVNDLYVQNGYASTVTLAGEALRTSTESVNGSWYNMDIPELTDVSSGGGGVVVSGVKARAIIHDKFSNSPRILLDSQPGNNYPNYWDMSLFRRASVSGSSGGESKCWIYDSLSNQSFPVSVSGEFNVIGYDIENDGRNDYVSVGVIHSGNYSDFGFDYGFRAGGMRKTTDTRALTVINKTWEAASLHIENANGYSVDSMSAHCTSYSSLKRSIAFATYDKKLNVWEIEFDSETQTLTPTLHTSGALSIMPNYGSAKVSDTVYNFYSGPFDGAASGDNHIYQYRYDLEAGTVTTNDLGELAGESKYSKHIIIDGVIYSASAQTSGYDSGFDLYLDKINMISGARTHLGKVAEVSAPEAQKNYYTFYLGGVAYDKFFLGQVDGQIVIILPYIQITKNLGIVWDLDVYAQFVRSGRKGNVHIYGPTDVSYLDNMKSTTIYTFGLQNVCNNNIYGQARLEWSPKFTIPPTPNETLVITFENETPILGKPLDTTLYYSRKHTGINTESFGFRVESNQVFKCGPKDLALTENLSTKTSPPWEVRGVFTTTDTFTDEIYYLLYNTDESATYIGTLDDGGEPINPIQIYSPSPLAGAPLYCFNTMGFFVINRASEGNLGTGAINYIHQPFTGNATSYYVLQRDNTNFKVVISGSTCPFRLDISNNSPLLVAQNSLGTLQALYINENDVAQTLQNGASNGYANSFLELRDFRYAYTESLITTYSGLSTILFTMDDGIYSMPMDLLNYYPIIATMSGITMSGIIPSGAYNMLETSNYAYPDQFIFASRIGPSFHQKNPEEGSGWFVDCSLGMPSSETTIIRLDDNL